jgi:hypothetical protein
VIGEDDRPLPLLIKEAEKKVEDVKKCVTQPVPFALLRGPPRVALA